jgi:hypothetical protein
MPFERSHNPVNVQIPSHEQLATEPELAALAVLHAALEVAHQVIAATHPGWGHCKSPSHAPSDRCLDAGVLRMMAAELQEDIETYLHPEDQEEED